jgi:hypothetical protein
MNARGSSPHAADRQRVGAEEEELRRLYAGIAGREHCSIEELEDIAIEGDARGWWVEPGKRYPPKSPDEVRRYLLEGREMALWQHELRHRQRQVQGQKQAESMSLQADSMLRIAKFLEENNPAGAIKYYDDVCEKFPGTPAASRAALRIGELSRK